MREHFFRARERDNTLLTRNTHTPIGPCIGHSHTAPRESLAVSASGLGLSRLARLAGAGRGSLFSAITCARASVFRHTSDEARGETHTSDTQSFVHLSRLYTSQRCRQLVQVAHVVARSTCVLPARIERCTLVDLPPQLSQRYRSVS